MKSKKAQGEVITTVLIILLVLAAIIIVWQVVMGVLNSGKTAIEAQQGCIGFTMTISNSTPTIVNVVPNKGVSGYRIFVANADQGVNKDSTPIAAMSSGTVTLTTPIPGGAEMYAAGKIGDTWCDGMNRAKA